MHTNFIDLIPSIPARKWHAQNMVPHFKVCEKTPNAPELRAFDRSDGIPLSRYGRNYLLMESLKYRNKEPLAAASMVIQPQREELLTSG